MNPAKKQVTRICLCLLLGLLTPISLLAYFNYYTDRFGVLHGERDFTNQTNLNFVRMQYLLEKGNRHNVILLGSSRANALDVSSQVSGSAYTLSVMGGVIHYHLLHLKALIESGISPDTVLLGLGEAGIRVVPQTNAEQPREFRLHPRTEDLNPLLYYWDYLVFVPTQTDLRLFDRQVSEGGEGESAGMSEFSLKFLRTGHFYCMECERRVLELTELEHAAALAQGTRRIVDDRKVRKAEGTFGNASGVSDAIATLREIADLAEANDIRLFIFIDPIYQALYLSDDMQSWMEFKRELSQISPFLDFSNFDSAFAEPRNFIDPVHYNQETGRVIMSDIKNGLESRFDDLQLGTWVTAENVNTYLQQQQSLYLSLQP